MSAVRGGTDNQKLVRHNKTAVASVTINGGSFGTAQPTTDCTELFVLGGDLMKHKGDNGGGNINAYAESEIGATHVTIKGGTFNSAVVGGSAAIVYYGNANKGAKTTVGTTNVTIEGGTFNHAIVAGGLASGHRTHSFVTEANLSVIAKDKDLAVNDSIFAGGVRRMDSFGGSGGSVEVKHATVRVEDVNVKGGIYGTSASLKMLTEKVQVDGKEKEKITGWEFKPLEIDGAVATVRTDMTLVNVTAKESILGKDSTLNVHGKVELGELKATGVKISLFDAPANTPKVQTFADDAPQTGTQLNLGKLTGTGNSFYFATSDASVNIKENGNAESETEPLIDSITGSGSVNDDVGGNLESLADMVTIGTQSGTDVLTNTKLTLESGDVFGECANPYVTACGQYWPAISAAVDAISGMPYPDHYSAQGDYKPWEHPYTTVHNFGESAMARQSETASPGAVRTWIQCYNAIREPYNHYGAAELADEVRALRDAGCTGGFMTWNGASDIDKYAEVISALS